MPESANVRIMEVEAKLTFAEETIEALNQTVIRQQRELDALKSRVDGLVVRLAGILEGSDGAMP